MTLHDDEIQALIDHGVPVKLDLVIEYEDEYTVVKATADDKHEFERRCIDAEGVAGALAEMFEWATELAKGKVNGD